MNNKSVSYSKYIDGILTFDEAFEGMTPRERYFLLNAQKMEMPVRENTVSYCKTEVENLNNAIKRYESEMKQHIDKLEKMKENTQRLIDSAKNNLMKYSHILEAGIPEE